VSSKIHGARASFVFSLLLLAALILLDVRAYAQTAQPFPAGKPVRIVIPAPPGGPADIIARALAAKLGPAIGDAVVLVESRPGGASVPAALAVARAAADGHTLLLTINTTHTQVPHMFSKPPYDPFKDFTPVTQVYRGGSILVAHPSVPARDLKELVNVTKTKGALPAGSPGPGTNGHLYIEMLKQDYGAQLEHIPYKGSSDATRELLGGFIRVLFDSPATAVPHIQAGRLKALAVTGKSRLSALPEVKTGTEMGFPVLEITGWMGVFAPANLPADVLAKLNAALVAAIRHPDVRGQFEPSGLEMTGTTPAEFAAIVRSDYETWGRIIRTTGVRLD
jgi:tripartite-type tricarboxylate transporter receptor subunit TctC